MARKAAPPTREHTQLRLLFVALVSTTFLTPEQVHATRPA